MGPFEWGRGGNPGELCRGRGGCNGSWGHGSLVVPAGLGAEPSEPGFGLGGTLWQVGGAQGLG